MKGKKTIVIDINLTRGLVSLLALALLMAAFVGYLAWNQGEVAASGPQAPLDHPFDLAQGRARDKPLLASSSGMRGYYLTKTIYNGAGPLTACADGYHFASLWEILDTSNLKYNTELGLTKDDSGQGPPTSPGWVRTGYGSSSSSTAGQGNCNAWTSSSSGDRGTYVYLPNAWTAAQDIHVWDVSVASCSNHSWVWCVED